MRRSQLTVGMAVYNDDCGAYFTISSLRAHHPHVEIIVIDNAPLPSTRTRDVCNAAGGEYFHLPNLYGTSAPRDEVFRRAKTPWAACVDSHVLFETGAVAALLEYIAANPDSNDIISGPLVYDNGSLSTHWRQTTPPGLWGVWDVDARGLDRSGPAFEIPMQGLGVWAMRVAAWPGFNPLFTGFGGEEGYIHEVVRQRGGRALCLPALRWRHWFRDPKQPPPYNPRLADHVWNLLIGHREVGIDATKAIFTDFGKNLETNEFDKLLAGSKSCAVRPPWPKVLGVWYSNNSAPQLILNASLLTIKRAADLSRANVTVVTCPWVHIEGNPHHEVIATYKNGPGHLNIARQQLQAILAAESLSTKPDIVCFLEHDVMYPPDYFDRVAKTFMQNPQANVVSNLDYEGLNASGWLRVKERHEPLHQLSMRYETAIANVHRSIGEAESTGSCLLEPQGDRVDWARIPPKGTMPSIHINHAKRFTSHGEVVFHQASGGVIHHQFWGDFRQWWPGEAQMPAGCGSCGGNTTDDGPPDMETWFAEASKGPSDFHEHMATVRELASQCSHVSEISGWNKPALLSMAAGCNGQVRSYCHGSKNDWRYLTRLLGDRFKGIAGQWPDIEPTDMLMVDTLHRADRVYEELARYSPNVRRYLVVHCTTDPFGEIGDDGGPGVMPGVRRFLNEHREWTAVRHDKNNHGLIVLSKLDDDKKQPPGKLRQAMNFAKALAKHAKDGARLVNDRVFELRMAECLTCPERVGDKCAACGCPVDAKASWASEDCGLVKLGKEPRWRSTTDPADIE